MRWYMWDTVASKKLILGLSENQVVSAVQAAFYRLYGCNAETPIAALQVLGDTSLQGCFVAHLKWRTTICDYGHE